MADPTTATTPKIEELRARLKADAKSRHFYPLAEELRKIHQLEEAEQILRDGLQTHSAYLSAWISLGRVLRDRGRDHEAVEVLKRALALDPGNVVAAKLLAQAYLGVGDKVEAIKKFKLVFALMPSDEEVEQSIQLLDRELNPGNYSAVPVPATPEFAVAPAVGENESEPIEDAEPLAAMPIAQPFAMVDEPSRFDSTDPVPFGVEEEPFGSTADSALSSLVEPVPEASSEVGAAEPRFGTGPDFQPSEESVFDQEAEPFGPGPDEIMAQPTAGAISEPQVLDADEGTQPQSVESSPSAPIPATITMARLYESQGHEAQAAQLYRQILEEKPDHEEARVALARAEAPAEAESRAPRSKREQIDRLERWRVRVART